MTPVLTWRGEIVGHRGAAGLAPENTLEGFEEALRIGVDRVEFDVRATADGGAVVFHDQRLDRFVPGAGFGRPVSRRSTAEMTALDVGAALGRPGCLVPSYAAVLDALAGRVKLNVEAKGSGPDGTLSMTACVDGVRDRGLEQDAVVSSFHEQVLAHALREAEDVPRALITGRDATGDLVARAARLRCEALHPHGELVTPELLERCRAEGLAVRVWTVNEPGDMAQLALLGVDGIVTDRPDLLKLVAGR